MGVYGEGTLWTVRPTQRYSNPCSIIVRGSYRFRPSRIKGVRIAARKRAKSGCRYGYHSVRMRSASAPSSAR